MDSLFFLKINFPVHKQNKKTNLRPIFNGFLACFPAAFAAYTLLVLWCESKRGLKARKPLQILGKPGIKKV